MPCPWGAVAGGSQDRKGRQRSRKRNRRDCLTDSCPDREREGKFCMFFWTLYMFTRGSERDFFFFFLAVGSVYMPFLVLLWWKDYHAFWPQGQCTASPIVRALGEPCSSSSDGSDWQPPVGEPGPAPHTTPCCDTWRPLGRGTAWKEEVPASQCGCWPQFREHEPFSLLESPGSSGQNSTSELQSPKQGSWVRTRKPGGLK